MPQDVGAFDPLQQRQKSGGGGSFRRIQFLHAYEDIISVENLLSAWEEFLRGKRKKKDVQEFELRLMDNILALHRDLVDKTYHHGPYHAFKISDPKPRDIHKATVRDRLLHHALYRTLYPFFDRTFIADSYSCRRRKGTHAAMNRFRAFAYQVSRNQTRTCFVLKCDIKKFFASIDQRILLDLLSQYIPDDQVIGLLRDVVESFSSTERCRGLPLGNLTSQLLVNVYMNRFDQFVKHTLKARHYIRYADDFVILLDDKAHVEQLIPRITEFLWANLRLTLHPDKVSIQTYASGVDFLGWVHFPNHRVLRTTSKHRMFRRLESSTASTASAESYLGMLTHGNAMKLRRIVILRKERFE